MYISPKTQFVASFLGNPPINIIPAKLEKGMIILDGQKPYHIGIEGNMNVNIGIRAEWFCPGDDIAVRVDDVEIKGRDQLIYFNLNGTPVSAIIDNLEIVSKGDVVHLGVKKNMIYVFDLETGRQINGNIK